MPLKEEARGYLALIEANNPGNKTLDVVPVWENQPEFAELYELYKSEVAASYPNIRFTLPVTYEASKYPRSDGMQAVSEISSRQVMGSGSKSRVQVGFGYHFPGSGQVRVPKCWVFLGFWLPDYITIDGFG